MDLLNFLENFAILSSAKVVSHFPYLMFGSCSFLILHSCRKFRFAVGKVIYSVNTGAKILSMKNIEIYLAIHLMQ